jgi:hypothetical protein
LRRYARSSAASREADWNRNLYWSWLYSLQALIAPVGEGYPNFMRTRVAGSHALGRAGVMGGASA